MPRGRFTRASPAFHAAITPTAEQFVPVNQGNRMKNPAGLMATINITNLRLRCYIGFNPEEQEKLQDIVINLSIRYVATAGILDDRVEFALDYKRITKEIIEYVDGNRFKLLEKLVFDVLGLVSRYRNVADASVTIDKPHALRFADSVSLSASYRATPDSHQDSSNEH